MFAREDCHAVIPCLNEARHIEGVVEAVRRHLDHVIVVDDGSQDDTARRARHAGARVVAHASPQGKGAALQAGWIAAQARGAQWALCLDGDAQHAAEDIPAFLDQAQRTDAPLIVGNRFAPDAPQTRTRPMPVVRRWTNRAMSRFLSLACRRRFPDSQCGFRMLHLGRARELHLRSRHFEIESEMLVAAARAGWRIDFVPIRTVYRHEASKIDPMLDSLRWMGWFVAATFPTPARQGARNADSTIRQPN